MRPIWIVLLAVVVAALVSLVAAQGVAMAKASSQANNHRDRSVGITQSATPVETDA
jgi:hypothetical protein